MESHSLTSSREESNAFISQLESAEQKSSAEYESRLESYIDHHFYHPSLEEIKHMPKCGVTIALKRHKSEMQKPRLQSLSNEQNESSLCSVETPLRKIQTEDLYQFLNEFAPEVIEAKERADNRFLKFIDKVTNNQGLSYARVRDIYRIQRQANRETVASFEFHSIVLIIRNAIIDRNLFLDWLSNSYVKLIWDSANLVRYLLFSMLYLFEIQSNSINKKPSDIVSDQFSWIVVYRDAYSYGILIVLAAITIGVKFIDFLAIDRGSISKIAFQLLEIITSLIFLLSLAIFHYSKSMYFYVPYFLFSLMVIPQVRIILRSCKNFSLNVSDYAMKLTDLLLYIILLVYLG